MIFDILNRNGFEAIFVLGHLFSWFLAIESVKETFKNF